MNFKALRDFQDFLTSWRLSGCDCEVRVAHETVHRYRSGYADFEEKRLMRGDEFYYLWSSSKVITAALALKLYEEGRFLLTDPLSAYAPEFAEMQVSEEQSDGTRILRPAKKPILVRDLFTMSAGFNYDLESDAIREVIRAKNGHATARDMLSAFAKHPLYFEPGERWSYSACHDVLGGFIELISGKRLRDYAREAIFEPLGMTDTSYGTPSRADFAERMMKQYIFDDATESRKIEYGEPSHMLTPDYDSGGAGVVSTVDDYITFADAMASGGVAKNGERILTAATIDLMRSDFLGERRKDMTWSQLTGYSYGLGVRTLVDRVSAGSLGPCGEFGWQGAAGTYVIIDPENRVAVFFAQQMRNSQEPYIAPRLRNHVYACLGR